MVIEKQNFSDMLLRVADLWQENVSVLSEIDSHFGDGDHGITIGKIASVTAECVHNWGDESIREFIESLESAILGISGGSAGPLYGTLIGGLAEPLGDETEIDSVLFKRMLQGSLAKISALTSASVGDKTMMDALIPAVDAAVGSSGSIPNILGDAAEAAAAGAEYSKSVASKFGRARSYGDQTIGSPDAGAVSTALLFQGLCEGLAYHLLRDVGALS